MQTASSKANPKKAIAFMKALTIGKHQTDWCIDTGYYPASAAAENEERYQAFLDNKSYTDELAVYKREGAETNHVHYSNAEEKWIRFVDDAFIGSAQVREAVKSILPNVFSQIQSDLDNTNSYYTELKEVLNQEKIKKYFYIFLQHQVPRINHKLFYQYHHHYQIINL